MHALCSLDVYVQWVTIDVLLRAALTGKQSVLNVFLQSHLFSIPARCNWLWQIIISKFNLWSTRIALQRLRLFVASKLFGFFSCSCPKNYELRVMKYTNCRENPYNENDSLISHVNQPSSHQHHHDEHDIEVNISCDANLYLLHCSSTSFVQKGWTKAWDIHLQKTPSNNNAADSLSLLFASRSALLLSKRSQVLLAQIEGTASKSKACHHHASIWISVSQMRKLTVE